MATVAANVDVAVTGAVYFAPVGTALPVATATALNAAFVELGYLGEDGITESVTDSVTELKAWQNSDIVRTLQTDHSATFKLTAIETNTNVLTAWFGGNYVAGVGQIKGGVMPRKSWVIDIVDGTYRIRIVVPNGQITERGDVMYKNAEAIGYPMTIEGYPDTAASVKAYVYYSTATVS